jgi:iduronate 2-sulfatase
MTNFEVALRTPLIIRAPWFPKSIGVTTSVLAEAVDFYPTLAGLVGLPDPKTDGASSAGINGTDLTPVFVDPVANGDLKGAAYSQFAKPQLNDPFAFWPTPLRNATQIMGYSVRVDEWRYTCWFKFNPKLVVPMTSSADDIIGRELYDHRGDPGLLDWKGEHANVAFDPANADVVANLHMKILAYISLTPI